MPMRVDECRCRCVLCHAFQRVLVRVNACRCVSMRVDACRSMSMNVVDCRRVSMRVDTRSMRIGARVIRIDTHQHAHTHNHTHQHGTVAWSMRVHACY